jgi:imidazole glycerol-phosphate synthase subunit HisH
LATTVAIIDLGTGNLLSVYRKLASLNANPIVTTAADEILKADKIILPGVGNFEKAMLQLKALAIEETLNEAVLIKRKQILGICLGMQLIATESEEGKVRGLGWINAKVVKFNIQDKIRYKVPQAGWNTVEINKNSRLLNRIAVGSEFYFLHSYHYKDAGCANIVAETEYEYRFVSVVEKDNIFGTQFHPEKSHLAGTQVLKNFIGF